MTPQDSAPAVGSPARRSPFWLLPNLLALDAPVVAVVWQGFLARVYGVQLPVAAVVSLFAAVWLVYLADRLLDARRLSADAADRHKFAARHHRLLIALAVVAVCAGAVSVFFLPIRHIGVGVSVAAVVGLYMAVVHQFRAGWVRLGVKELLVGVVFAAGVAVPQIADDPSLDWVPGVIGFGLICWWNCRLIDRWEVQPTAGRVVGRVIGLSAVLVGWFSPWPVLVTLAASAILLLAIDLAAPRLGVRVARVLADAVLLTPLCVWAFT